MTRNFYCLFQSIILFIFIINISCVKAQSEADTINGRIQNAIAEGRIVDQLSPDFINQPKGEFLIAPDSKDLNFAILVYNIDIFPDKAVFSAGMAFREPKSNQLIAFKAENISFSRHNGLAGPVKLVLISDCKFKIGQAAEIFLKGQHATYAVFECKGLKEFGVNGQILFNSGFIQPVGENGKIAEGQKVKADFTLVTQHWSQWLVQFAMPSFQLRGLTGYVFNISNAVLDLNEQFNATDMKFPGDYPLESITGSSGGLWEGFYLQKGVVSLPSHFSSTEMKRTTIGVQDLLIDEFGFSGAVFGGHVLPFNKGKLGGWKFSIDTVCIGIVMNELISGLMGGGLGMPVLPDTSQLNYVARIGLDNSFGMTVSINKQLTIPALKIAKLTLRKNSYINVDIVDEEVLLQAMLNGQLDIANSNAKEGVKFKLPSVEFQGMQVTNHHPSFQVAYLGLKNNQPDSQHFSRYPITIHRLYYTGKDNFHGIGVDFSLNLVSKIAVKGGLLITCKISDVDRSKKLEFDRIAISNLNLNANFSCFTFAGQLLVMNEDPKYGNGLAGLIKFSMTKPDIKAQASIMFGNVKGHRYWYFDAAAKWSNPCLPFVPGAEINGFIGGASWGMREFVQTDGIINSNNGSTASGKIYVPDVKSGFGFKAGLSLKSVGGSGSSNAFTANTILEIQFNAQNGINRLSLYGDIDLMTKQKEVLETDIKANVKNSQGLNQWTQLKNNYVPKGKAGGPFLLDFDFKNNVYQANCAVYFQGIANDKITGAGHRGLAGEIAAYFSPTKWYFWVGTPLQPLALKLKINKIADASLSAYFMAGTDVKSAAPLPAEITSLLGESKADGMRSLNEIAVGNAFAFGARFAMVAGSSGNEKNVSIYANLNAIIGFDINLSNYGKNVHCTSSNETPGINGWFAKGELYAFLQGRVGAKFKTKIISGSVDLLTLTMASKLYCEGPNPFYSTGSTMVHVNIAGIINAKMKLQFEIGEQCEMLQEKLNDTAIIISITPEHLSVNVNPLSLPKVKFSVPIGKQFSDSKGRPFVFSIKKFELSDNGRLISGKMLWNDLKNEMTFEPFEALPGRKKLRLLVQVEAVYVESSYQLVNPNGQSINVLVSEQNEFNKIKQEMEKSGSMSNGFSNGRKVIRKNQYIPVQINGKNAEESTVICFETGAQPTTIATTNIVASYPVMNQVNYYTDAGSQHFIQLALPQSYLFNVSGTKTVALLSDIKGDVVAESKVQCDGKLLAFNLSNGVIKSNQSYRLTIKRVAANSITFIGKKLSTGENTNTNSGSSLSFNGNGTTNTVLTTSKPSVNEITLLSYVFGVSEYGTLANKIKNFKFGIPKQQGNSGYDMQVVISDKKELLDAFELPGITKDHILLKPILNYRQSSWFMNKAMPVYSLLQSKDLNLLQFLQLNRDTALFGLIPYKGLQFVQTGSQKLVMMTDKTGNSFSKPSYAGNSLKLKIDYKQIVIDDFNSVVKGLTTYVVGNQKINSTALNLFINYYSNSQSSSGTNALPNSAKVLMSNQTVSSNKPISPNPKIQNNPWLYKLSTLKFENSQTDQVLPLLYYYYLPSSSKPSIICQNSYSILP
ncbi:MAG: hypothetical protein V4613_00700 [Bacteroidota bacterium]